MRFVTAQALGMPVLGTTFWRCTASEVGMLDSDPGRDDPEPSRQEPQEPLGPVETPEPGVVDVPEPGVVEVPERRV